LNFETIQVDSSSEKIITVTLNRPRQFNALNKKMIEELREVLELPGDFLLITGSGRAFCFGADFNEFQDRLSLPGMLGFFQDLILNLHHSTKITFACLNGFATGAGLDLALACDFRIAAEKIKLGEAYISMGLVPDGGGSYFLPRLIGMARAMELLLTGDAIAAEEALSIGLVHRVVPSAELLPSALRMVEQFASKPDTARKLIKRLIVNPTTNLVDALFNEREAQLKCFEDPDHLRLAQEFLKKRKA